MADTKDPLRNPKDPLHKAGPEGEKELFRAMSALCNGYTHDQIINASANMILNCLRQAFAKRDLAALKLEEVVSRTREVLLSQHYDSMGNRRNVFPFHQHIQVDALLENKSKW